MRYSRLAMLNLSKIKAITLDLDDTLWPIRPTIERAEQALQDWLKEHAPKTAHLCAQPHVKNDIRESIHKKYPDRNHDLSFLRLEAIRESLVLAGDATDLAESAFEVFFAARQNVTLYDGVQEALEKLSQRFPLVSISNGNADVFATKAAPFFNSSVSARFVGVLKPDLRIFQAAAAQLNLPAEAILHLGDDINADVVGAINAGMQSIWVNTQGHEWRSEKLQPLTVNHLSEVCDHVLT